LQKKVLPYQKFLKIIKKILKITKKKEFDQESGEADRVFGSPVISHQFGELAAVEYAVLQGCISEARVAVDG
jgi:hypothetical protein